ncbi:EAL domain-containing protein (putative c-di-GMP-specific phosphodiesterase class I) [Xylophilus ampelinus]|uniref:EAL domain-containing protein (Putative c-di-GMP-specific phosphodiesterase class I) n=2 Tax=Xylophilus ampelinus TaxID=54067 RepID=A0A318SJQ7_9BURK|nr:EAL domain-containing protein (putative c-di-GMP-specific phosphodiesterase class I) [Xylophilus ampelinus]
MAFQPIVDVAQRTVFGYEALVRGLQGEDASSILSQVGPRNRYAFDQACRVRAIELASTLGLQSMLSINFLPNAVYRAEACIRLTLATAEKCRFPLERIMFELTEDERTSDVPHLVSIFSEYRKRGFITAIDDFGAGFSNFGLLVDFAPDVIKIDMHLLRNIHLDARRRTIAQGLLAICHGLGSRVIAEGVEQPDEVKVLRDMGVTLFQGYVFARPALAALPPVDWSGALGKA